jgi:hypothetical protein
MQITGVELNRVLFAAEMYFKWKSITNICTYTFQNVTTNKNIKGRKDTYSILQILGKQCSTDLFSLNFRISLSYFSSAN